MKFPRETWQWFGHHGHLNVGEWCRFHLCTQVGPWLVSTIGEYWPERQVREIHADIWDSQWLAQNRFRKGDDFDAAYMERFGFEKIGLFDRKYETMVFQAGKPCDVSGCDCGQPGISGDNLDFTGYEKAGDALRGHYAMCERWAENAGAPAA